MAETYPIAQMTIEGQTFEVIEPYKEGDVLSANEASQLNQVFRENVGNNIRKQIKDMLFCCARPRCDPDGGFVLRRGI